MHENGQLFIYLACICDCDCIYIVQVDTCSFMHLRFRLHRLSKQAHNQNKYQLESLPLKLLNVITYPIEKSSGSLREGKMVNKSALKPSSPNKPENIPVFEALSARSIFTPPWRVC